MLKIGHHICPIIISEISESKRCSLHLPEKVHKIHENLAPYVSNSNLKHFEMIKYIHDTYTRPETGHS